MSDDQPIIGGRWKLERTLGAGAMGEVWAAQHVVTGQPAAVKILHSHVGHDPRSVQRFTREVQAAATIDHPGVAAVYDGGRDANGALYIAMELLEGESLGDWLRRSPSLTQVLRVFARLLDALSASHAVGIIHRDIKPDNIFVLDGPATDRPVKLLDFGIARYEEGKQGATQTGLTVGTPFYMSPEQAMDPRTCGPQADIWSLGIILYEVLAGHPPFSGETSTAVCLAAIQQPHGDLHTIAPTAPKRLLAAIDRCLEKQPKDRFPSAKALRDEIVLVLAELADRPVAIARQTPHSKDSTTAGSTQSAAATGRRRALWIVLLIGLVSAVVTWIMLRRGGDPRPAPSTTAPRSATPETTAPATTAPPTAAPPTAAPPTAAPPTTAPPTAAPRPVAPRTAASRAPRTRSPRPRPPRTRAPRTAAPRTAAPRTAAPVTAAPATVAPITAAPQTAAPQTAAPATAAPRTAAPKAPPSTAPASTAPTTEPFFSF